MLFCLMLLLIPFRHGSDSREVTELNCDGDTRDINENIKDWTSGFV
jgi:hypothetical protein